MVTYSQIKFTLDEIAQKSARNREYLKNARSLLTRAQDGLIAMSTDYSGIVADINQAVINNPVDDAYLMAKNEKDKLVADFQNLKNYANALITAYDAVAE